MDETIFRAYSIRGVFDENLTAQDMRLIGQAAGTVLSRAGITRAVVGRDYRLSSAELSIALLKGLISTGMHLTDIGTCPTPLLNFATDYYQAGAGLMVTASHNPPQYNGLKIRTDHTLCEDELKAIYQIAQRREFCRGEGTLAHQEPLDRVPGGDLPADSSSQGDGSRPALAIRGRRWQRSRRTGRAPSAGQAGLPGDPLALRARWPVSESRARSDRSGRAG